MSRLPSNYKSYLEGLPIPREVVVDDLSPAEIDAIGKTVFITTEIQPADLLFVFGSSIISDHIWHTVAAYFQQNYFPKIVVAGLIGRAYYQTGRPLAYIARDQLLAQGVPADAIRTQDRSTNTYEDVSFTLATWPELAALRSMIFVSKAHHSGRCWRTLRQFFPDTRLHALTYDAVYDGIVVAAHNWPDHPVSRGRVYGEFLRIKKYAARGDIAL